jgi:PmbA protein
MDYLALAKSVVQKASTNGLEVEVIITEEKETSIAVQMGKVEKLSQAGSHGMGVRVISNGQTGYAFTSDLSDASIEETWRSAVDLARVATPDPFRKLPEPEPILEDDLDIWDESLSGLPTADKIDWVIRMEKAALDYHEKIFLTTFTQYGDSILHQYLANSKGFAGSYGRTTTFGIVGAIAKDDDGSMVNAFGLGASNFFKDLDAEEIGRTAGRKTMSILGGKPVPSQTASVVLDHFVGAQIFGALAQALSAEAWQKQRSFLIGRMGKEVGSSMVTLMDNGRMKGGLASAPFDAEGVPTKATRLVDEGVLQNLIYDSYSAAKDGKFSTGNAQRNGHRSLPNLGVSNFYIQPGNKSPDEIIAGVERGFYVLSVMQTGGIDPVTGDCSMLANGLWIENGKLQQAVGGVTIATTLDGFMQNLCDVGSDLQQIPFFGSTGVPTMRVDNVRIGGVDT